MGDMSPYYFKTIFRLCMKCIPSFIKIGGVVSEKNGNIRQTFVILYIGWESWFHVIFIQKQKALIYTVSYIRNLAEGFLLWRQSLQKLQCHSVEKREIYSHTWKILCSNSLQCNLVINTLISRKNVESNFLIYFYTVQCRTIKMTSNFADICTVLAIPNAFLQIVLHWFPRLISNIWVQYCSVTNFSLKL